MKNCSNVSSMKILTALFLAAVLAVQAQAQNTENAIPFTLLESGHILIKARVDGVEGNFIFDTGAGHNLLFENFAEKLGPKETYNFFVAHRATGESITVPIYTSKELRIGNHTFENQIYSTFAMDIEGIDGLISLQAFAETPFTIYFKNKVITTGELSDADKKKFIDIQIADYAGKALDIFTNITLNDTITVQALLDAGAGKNSFWIHSKFMETLGLDTAEFTLTEKRSEFDAAKINRFYKGSLGSIKTENGTSEVEFPETTFVEGMIYEAKTGIMWLGEKIAISLPDKKIYIIE